MINETDWEEIRKQVEIVLEDDSNLTDITINYQVKAPRRGTRNYLNLNVKLNN